MRTYVTKYTDVEVEVEFYLADVLEFVSRANQSELKKIKNDLDVFLDNDSNELYAKKVTSLMDEYKMTAILENWDKFNEEEFLNFINGNRK